jgi:hypothetical protein
MAKFSNNKISVQELLRFIPDKLLDKLSTATNVDHQVKKLYGKNIFYLLLYGYLESTKISLRELEDIYSSQRFQFLFNIDSEEGIKYNSLSDRLSMMNPEYFERIYKYIYTKFSELYSDDEALTYSITRVDSTFVAEAANKLQKGLTTGTKLKNRRQIKYTISMTDIFPSGAEVFFESYAHNENNTIPLAIKNAIHKDSIFVFDRGVHIRRVFKDIDRQGIKFVTRINRTKNFKVITSNERDAHKHNNLEIISDQIVYLRDKKAQLSIPLRLIITKQIDKKEEEIFFLTNHFELQTTEVIDIYKKRWDIEVFFRFIKQELNFSHFLSTNENGIKNVLYITLILAILILVYKKINNLGYKTAVRRFKIELDELIMKMTIIFAGGDPDLVFR